jgi:hypothetical protein
MRYRVRIIRPVKHHMGQFSGEGFNRAALPSMLVMRTATVRAV